jgi:hypothetical protein
MFGRNSPQLEQGRFYMTLSAVKYDTVEFDKLWNSIEPNGGINLGTLFHHAMLNGHVDPSIVASPQINEVNKLFCLIEGVGIFDKYHGRFIQQEQFKQLYSNRLIDIGSPDKPKIVSLDKVWNASHLREQYTGLELAPGQPERTRTGALNTYNGFSIEQVAGNIKPFHDLMTHVITSKKDRGLFLQFMAYKLQNPGKSFSFALVLQSLTQGIGKNLLVESCTRLFNDRHCTVVGQEVFSDQFTDWQSQKLFVVADEVSSSNSRSVSDRVKGWITTAENSINGKGQPRYDEPNKIAYVFISNHPDAVYIDKNDRRFAVLECSSKKLRSTTASKFVRWRDNGGSAHLLHFLLNLNVGSLNPRAHAPMSRAKQNMINANKSDLERWVETIVTATNLANLLGREVATVEELSSRYRRESSREVSAKAMSNALSKAGIRQMKKQAKRSNGTRPRVYALKNATKYDKLSSKMLGEVLDQNMFK